jgi:acyl carrier protein
MEEANKIKAKIREFILKTSYVSAEELGDDTLIFAEGIMDSMGFISIIGFLEEEFSVATRDEDLIEENFESIRAISEFVQRKAGVLASQTINKE